MMREKRKISKRSLKLRLYLSKSKGKEDDQEVVVERKEPVQEKILEHPRDPSLLISFSR